MDCPSMLGSAVVTGSTNYSQEDFSGAGQSREASLSRSGPGQAACSNEHRNT